MRYGPCTRCGRTIDWEHDLCSRCEKELDWEGLEEQEERENEEIETDFEEEKPCSQSTLLI